MAAQNDPAGALRSLSPSVCATIASMLATHEPPPWTSVVRCISKLADGLFVYGRHAWGTCGLSGTWGPFTSTCGASDYTHSHVLYTTRNGLLHSIDGEPARITTEVGPLAAGIGATREWFRDGYPWRVDDLPVAETPNVWRWTDDVGRWHRENDQPAVVYFEATDTSQAHVSQRMWYRHGRKHRDDDRPAMVFAHEGTEHFWFRWYIDDNAARATPSAPYDVNVTYSSTTRSWWLDCRWRVAGVDRSQRIETTRAHVDALIRFAAPRAGMSNTTPDAIVQNPSSPIWQPNTERHPMPRRRRPRK